MTACAPETAACDSTATAGAPPPGSAGPGSADSPDGPDGPDELESPDGAGAAPPAGGAPGAGRVPGPALTIAADGSYAARLLPDPGGGLLTERWTLGGPEPYAVLLPGVRPEEPDSEVLPLADGRVLIHRRSGERHVFALLYPTGPATGELPVGGVECERLRLLPPSPDGSAVYALAPAGESTALWRVHGGSFGPERITDIPGPCSGGAWLDRAGRLLALDRTDSSGRTKTIAVDLGRAGETSPLLQLAEDSDDRLLLADPDSGLLLLRSDAPGRDRLGWGVLGSTRPVRFPDSLLDGPPGGVAYTPFAAQPGQTLLPESCGVALRTDGPDGTGVAVWRPSEGRLRQLAVPEGWLAGTGVWTAEGELRLPYATADERCGLARSVVPARPPERETARSGAPERQAAGQTWRGPARDPAPERAPHDGGTETAGDGTGTETLTGTAGPETVTETGAETGTGTAGPENGVEAADPGIGPVTGAETTGAGTGAVTGAYSTGAGTGAESTGAGAGAEAEGPRIGAEAEDLRFGAEAAGPWTGAETDPAGPGVVADTGSGPDGTGRGLLESERTLPLRPVPLQQKPLATTGRAG
ncbi:hypothetical protein [Streptomyces lycii]|uniref:Uncharacterized protein n=1 Tax=Streptomyces lycii TaxID=2654337 RepID=A0ABQ7FDH2_9ACTN|nr:hypothetical protein GCU69_23505 [Streptomyces lycii]